MTSATPRNRKRIRPPAVTVGIDWIDRKIMRFVLAWLPYDCLGSADVFPELGISTTDLMQRYHQIVRTLNERRPTLNPADVRTATAHCAGLATQQLPCGPVPAALRVVRRGNETIVL